MDTHFNDRAVRILDNLEGHTLSERLARGRLTLPEALRISAEIADGLAAAHRAGLVHREGRQGATAATTRPVATAAPISTSLQRVRR